MADKLRGGTTIGGNIAWHSGNSNNSLVDWVANNINAITIASTTFTGDITLDTDKRLITGPNSSWGATLSIGGNGQDVDVLRSSIAPTNANLHIDCGTAGETYLNFYSGTGGINFGDGLQHVVANVSNTGAITATAFAGPLNGNATTATTATTALNADKLDGKDSSEFFQGTKTISTATPSGGAHGDVWYQV